MASIFDQLNNAAKDSISSIKNAEAAVKSLTRSATESGKGFDSVLQSLKSSEQFSRSLTKSISGFIDVIPGFGAAASVINDVGGALSSTVGITGKLGEAYKETLNLSDSFSSGLRVMDAQLFDLGLRFGGTFEEAKNFTDGLLEESAKVSKVDFGYINSSELIEAVNKLSNSRISFDRMSESISTTSGNMDLLTASILQSGASGLESSSYYDKLGDAIMKQGLSAEGAMEQIAGFSEISKDTGLTVSSVANSLNDLANSFSQMGLSADFGRPFIKGFANTLDGMGLGIENAIGLSGQLSKSLASLTTDYATSFITAQRGGLDVGSGTALGAGIQLQARLLDAQASGDEQEQANIAQEMSLALRDTLASFTGGEIVTVQEAAENPMLETQFYTQSKILQDMYNIDQNSSARTLELLSELDEAISSGNEDLSSELSKQIEEQIDARDQSLDLMMKQNALTSGILNETMVQTRALLYMPRIMAESNIFEPANDYMFEQFENMQSELNKIQRNSIGSLNREGNEPNSFEQIVKSFEESVLSSAKEELKNAVESNNLPKDENNNYLDINLINRIFNKIDNFVSTVTESSSFRQSGRIAGAAGHSGNSK